MTKYYYDNAVSTSSVRLDLKAWNINRKTYFKIPTTKKDKSEKRNYNDVLKSGYDHQAQKNKLRN